MSIRKYDESEGFVTAEQWSSIIEEHQGYFSKGKTIMASWVSSADRTSDITAINVVIFEDGELDILSRSKSDNKDYIRFDDDFKHNVAMEYISNSFPYPVNEEICDFLKKIRKGKAINEIVKKKCVDCEVDRREFFEGFEMIRSIKRDEALLNSFCDYEALFDLDEYADTFDCDDE